MIDINLVPESLRKKRKPRMPRIGALNVPKEAIIGVVGGFIALLFLVFFVLQGLIFVKYIQHKSLKGQWEEILPDKQKVDLVLTELRTLRNKINSIGAVTTQKRILWSEKLNAISDSIPKGVWLNKISFKNNILIVDGSAVSKIQDEMISVGTFTSNLKKQANFTRELGEVEVGSIKRRKIKSIEVADFLITVKLR